ncbi:acyltransferase family protein, partial [Canicola haemoglobinophilus]
MSKFYYRPEIDGLRAIAVLSVMLFHLNSNWLPGGFLGVDIFFVISGYLITSIISQEIQNNTFSYKNFYNRRIKRIYPVFILMLAIVSIIASLFFVHHEYEELRKTIKSATLFLSNLYLSHRQGYFDLAANENPILHIWSLAVEEQYYLFFPLLLVIAYKKFKTNTIFKPLILILIFLFILTSFIPQSTYSIIGLHNLYYVSFMRFPELLIGSYLALNKQTNK